MKSCPKSWWMLSVGVLVCLWTQGARAESCKESSDCPKGFTCHEYQAGACTQPACEPGKMCPPPPPCEVVIEHECIPASCETNADCADFMVCYESTVTECSGGAAEPAVDCPPNEPCTMTKATTPVMPVCTEHKTKQCTPRYELPCQTETDCGAGFSCEATEQCMCSGSAGTAAAEPASAPDSSGAAVDAGTSSSSSDAFAPVPAQDGGTDMFVAAKDAGAPVCECHKSDVKYCRVKEVMCEADKDCPANFACVTYATGSGSASCAAPRDGDGGVVCTTVETKTVEEKRCQPKYYGGGDVGVSKDGSAQAPTSGGAMGIPMPGSAAAGSGAPVPATDPRHSDDGAESAAEKPAEESASCSVRGAGAHSSDGSAAGYALAFVLVALSLRRRRQR